MLPEAYHELHALETHHWWYVGARMVYRALLEMGLGKPDATKRMLEIGCGSGGNFRMLEEFGPTVGIEVSREALRLVSKRPGLGLVQADAVALPFPEKTFAGVNLLGVIEHLDDDGAALSEARRVCQPDGVVVLLTSAFPMLWSHHDEANRHKRRYLINQLRKLLIHSGLSPIQISYQNFFVFLPTLLARKAQKLVRNQSGYDMGNPPAILNSFLIQVMRLEAWLLRWIKLPFGVDLVAVCRPKLRKF